MVQTSSLPRLKLADGMASSVLREMKIDGLYVDPKAIAARKDIFVQAKPDTAQGVSGMLVKVSDSFGIMYATNIPSSGFQRFSIAHELGHYFIEGHCDALLTSGVHMSQAGFISDDRFEKEADHFAASLLMPERPFRRATERFDAGMTCVQALHKECDTSLTATAIRYAGLTRDAAAVILSRGQTIECCFMSDTLKDVRGQTWLKKGTPVPQGSATANFNAKAENVRVGKSDSAEALLGDWLGGSNPYKILEEVVGLGAYGRTLTILTCPKLSSADDPSYDDSDEDELVESWTPKFR